MTAVDLGAVVRSTASAMGLLDGDRITVLDSLTLIELVAALEDATGLDLLGMPLAIESFRSVDSIVAVLERARSD